MPVFQREQRLRELKELRARITREITHLETEIAAGRRGQPVRPPTPATPPPIIALNASAAVIRAWARQHGIPVPTRGRVSHNLREQYADAQGQ